LYDHFGEKTTRISRKWNSELKLSSHEASRISAMKETRLFKER